MKKTALLTLLAACAALAQHDARKTKPKPAPDVPVTIPAGSVKDGDHYRFVDKNGKAWIFSETPFGVKKIAESDITPTPNRSTGSGSVATPFGTEHQTAPAPDSAASPDKTDGQDRTANITAVRDGDLIRFEKPSPFGPAKWSKNVNDLTPEEQKVWQREQAKRNQ